ncbi:MAG: hypothetical protein JXR94_20510 [Candidatus Hydrogenedentes bacterium]|nr:hypothetical protein [Candidatus Hydrogenedentota bacterium]
MKTKSLIVNFPGYPFDINQLLPVHQLASVAACLLAEGHETQICDFATPDTMATLFPAEARDTATALADYLLMDSVPNPMTTLHLLWRVRTADRAYRRRHGVACARATGWLASARHLDFVVLHLATADDFHGAATMAEGIKALRPGVGIVVLGAFADLFAVDLLDAAQAFDCVCVGDPEHGIVGLADSIHERDSWRRIPNLVYRDGGRAVATERRTVVNLDHLPAPAYEQEVYPAVAAGDKLHLFGIEESRGCGGSCRGCPQAGGPGRDREAGPLSRRTKSAAAVCDEIEALAGRYGASAFRILGSGTEASRIDGVASAILARGIRASYTRTVHPAAADAPGGGAKRPEQCEVLLRGLQASGCVGLTVHAETGSQRLLDDHFGAGFTVTQLERVLRGARGQGLFTVARLTFPTPPDDRHTRAETLRLLERTMPHAAPVEMPLVLPGSAWYSNAASFGYAISRRHHFARILRHRTQFPLPPDRWRLLPQGADTLSPGQAIAAHEELLCDIRQQGILAAGFDGAPLLAQAAGHNGPLGEFIVQLQRDLLTGNAPAVARLVARFNQGIRVAGTRAGLHPYAPAEKAANN